MPQHSSTVAGTWLPHTGVQLWSAVGDSQARGSRLPTPSPSAAKPVSSSCHHRLPGFDILTTAHRHPHSVDPLTRHSPPVLLGSGAAGSWLLASHPPCSTASQQDSAGQALQKEVFHPSRPRVFCCGLYCTVLSEYRIRARGGRRVGSCRRGVSRSAKGFGGTWWW